MFEKVLIANRGEIAVRVIQTCKRMGIKTVAVYSEADNRSLHRLLADEAVFIGASPSRESYLDIQKVIAAALSTGAQAIHPGYGFLSEHPEFAKAVADAGLVFIGPSAAAISIMGDKIASKKLALKADVPVIPGQTRALKDANEALSVAEAIGYPVLLKPAAGGGGKGMRIVRKPEDMETALASSQTETSKSFGDNRIFIERYIDSPRHIEFQILADAYGNVVHLGERECSIQRRYQKMIEESPSSAVSRELRQRMGRAASELARKAGYVNAGTVEFVLDPRGEFFFLEMNTRLQVEHPVTEMITGLDLVELQLRIADGERLPFDQSGVKVEGWAMEARICAEDPNKDFLPSTGLITRYSEPRGRTVRVDSGVKIGSTIPVFYDSMLAKVISYGRDREAARLGLVDALNSYHVEGVATNADFVSSVLCHPEFAKGNLSTGFIAQHYQGSQSLLPPDAKNLELAALIAAIIYHARTAGVKESLRTMASTIGGSHDSSAEGIYKARAGSDLFDVEIRGGLHTRLWTATINGQSHTLEMPEFEFYRRRLKLKIDGQSHHFRLRYGQNFVFVFFSGIARFFEIYAPKEWEVMQYMPNRFELPEDNQVVCPMPGLVVAVLAKKGDRVFKGQNLVILESMKMETGVPSPLDGVIKNVRVSTGQAVELGEVLVTFED